MCQSLSSCSYNEKENYEALKKLFYRYNRAIKSAVRNNKQCNDGMANARTNEIDSILQSIERFPISWKYYTSQKKLFSQDFEFFIVFHSCISS